MTDNNDLKELDLRISRIEKLVESIATRAAAEPEEITSEEIKAYQKVKDVVAADWGHFCGINDCFRCIIQRCFTQCIQNCIQVCDIECSCGPCSFGGLQGQRQRFSNLG